MIRRIKYWIFRRLLNDITSRIIKKRGCVYLSDIRADAAIDHLALQAWDINNKGADEH